jgi:c-di-GMP-binding flagellar brake protein YcgR
MDERRRNVRINTATIVQYKDGFFTGNVDTVSRDVSLGGICFFTEKKLSKGRIIKLRLFLDGKKPAKVLKGKVAWSREFSDHISKGYISGITYVR